MRARRRRGPPYGFRPWLWGLLGGAAALGGLAALVMLPVAWAERDDYHRGARCPETVVRDCARDAGATVVRAELDDVRGDRYHLWLRLDHQDFAARSDAGDRIELPAPDALWDALKPGLRVGVRLWDGTVARVDVEGAGSAETEYSPHVALAEQAVFGLLFLAGGGLALWAGDDVRRRSGGWRRRGAAPRPDARGPRAVAARGLAALGLAGFVCLVRMDAFDVHQPERLAPALLLAPVLWAVAEVVVRRFCHTPLPESGV